MKIFNKVAIIGVGLIGGSIGLAIKKRRLAGGVAGVFRRKSTLARALKRKAIDRAFLSVPEGVKDADLVVIATPVHAIPSVAEEALEYARPGAIITDTGSTKRWVVKSAERHFEKDSAAFFVGSHPMAGSDQAGVEAATDDLLEGAPCIVTKTRNTDKSALRKVVSFWSSLGSNVTIMTPEEHDRSISFVSHLPHLVAFGIAGAVPGKYIKYAAEGFRDTTRVASSDPDLWADILLTNKDDILKSAKAFEKFYKKIVTALAANDYRSLVKLLAEAKAKRDKFNYKNI